MKIYHLLRGFLFSLLFSGSLHAQQDVSGFFTNSMNDISLLIENYAAPFIKGEGYAVANGWYGTAKSKSTLGIDFNLSISNSFLPPNEQHFTFIPQQYQFISLQPGESNKIPTAVGPEKPGPVLQGSVGGVTFYTPEGVGIPKWQDRPLAFMPIAQMGIGLVAKTEIKIRYWPEIKIGKTKNKMAGVAIMHEISQWIPWLDDSAFNVSFLGGYTRLKSVYDFTGQDISAYEHHSLFTIESYTSQLILSRDFSIITIFGSLGYNFISSKLAYEGVFELNGPNGEVYEAVLEPISISLKYRSPQVLAGITSEFSFVAVHATLGYAEYPFGVFGMSVRLKK